ncbi:uridine kinase [Actinosynnema sp. NPDC000082]|uniref:uridine kinase family protein n=1 Tax=Actinosynnema sp. NPDC000082 TaxID=3363910 RepID=UPI00369AB4BE
MPSPAVHARVVLLAGPSGSGKTHLAAHLGWPVLRLDDFYREGTDPLLPRRSDGVADWDSPLSWDVDAALGAIVELATTGSVQAPVYEFASDSRVGSQKVALNGAPAFLAEGLFADRLVELCRDAGVLGDAVVLDPSAPLTFVRRFARDVVEARKPVPYLVRRGLRLLREHPSVVRRCRDAGMRPTKPKRARAELELIGRRDELAAA